MISLLNTNVILQNQIRKNINVLPDSFISIISVGELESLALQLNWGYQKQTALNSFLSSVPLIDIDSTIAKLYGFADAYSQGKLLTKPLPSKMTARNMGKNDIWIAATALYYDIELHITDHDFDHLINIGLKLNKKV
ncbi:MAG: PIN domain-containing protein [Cyclobacteriaceae bacterium]|nr:PIN domain-containing protein [Cyclobacteriaceae bacterium]